MTAVRERVVAYQGSDGPRQIYTETYASEAPEWRGGCIALHSGPGFGLATLRPGIEHLAAATDVTLVDLPGCGRSSRHPGSGYPMEAYIDDIRQVRRQLAVQRPFLLGHGWGAILAVETALEHPTDFAGVTLVNPLRVLNGSGQDGEAQARQVERVDHTLLTRFSSDVLPKLQQAMQGLGPWADVESDPWWPQMWLTQWAGPPSPAWQDSVDRVTPGLEAYFAHKGMAMFDPQSRWARYDLAERLGALGKPATVLASQHDANYVALPMVHVDPLRKARPDLPVDIVADGGHFLMAESPAVVVGHLRRRMLPHLLGKPVSR